MPPDRPDEEDYNDLRHTCGPQFSGNGVDRFDKNTFIPDPNCKKCQERNRREREGERFDRWWDREQAMQDTGRKPDLDYYDRR